MNQSDDSNRFVALYLSLLNQHPHLLSLISSRSRVPLPVFHHSQCLALSLFFSFLLVLPTLSHSHPFSSFLNAFKASEAQETTLFFEWRSNLACFLISFHIAEAGAAVRHSSRPRLLRPLLNPARAVTNSAAPIPVIGRSTSPPPADVATATTATLEVVRGALVEVVAAEDLEAPGEVW